MKNEGRLEYTRLEDQQRRVKNENEEQTNAARRHVTPNM